MLTATNAKIIVDCCWSCMVYQTNRDDQSYCEGTMYYTSGAGIEYASFYWDPSENEGRHYHSHWQRWANDITRSKIIKRS